MSAPIDRDRSTSTEIDTSVKGAIVGTLSQVWRRTPALLRPAVATLYWGAVAVVVAFLKVLIGHLLGKNSSVDWVLLGTFAIAALAAALCFGAARAWLRSAGSAKPWLLGLLAAFVFWSAISVAATVKNGRSPIRSADDVWAGLGVVLVSGALMGLLLWANVRRHRETA